MWLKRTLGHLKEISRMYRSEISPFISTLDTVSKILSVGRAHNSLVNTFQVVFSTNVDERLTAVFQEIKHAPYLVA